jgi:hypothetical protein
MALVRGTPQLLVETDADGGLGFESRDGRTVTVVTRDNHAAEHAAMGIPLWQSGLFFILFAGDGGSNGLVFNGSGSGAFTLSAGIANFRPAMFYAYLPADQAYSGSAAGWYYGTMSTTTAGVLYADVYDPTTGVVPTIPPSPTTLPVTKLTRLTQSTSEITFMQAPARQMNNDDLLRVFVRAVSTNSAGTKSLYSRADSDVMWQYGWTSASNIVSGEYSWQVCGSPGSQIVSRSGTLLGQGGFTSLAGNEFKSANLSGPWLLKHSMQITANSEYFAVAIASANIT